MTFPKWPKRICDDDACIFNYVFFPPIIFLSFFVCFSKFKEADLFSKMLNNCLHWHNYLLHIISTKLNIGVSNTKHLLVNGIIAISPLFNLEFITRTKERTCGFGRFGCQKFLSRSNGSSTMSPEGQIPDIFLHFKPYTEKKREICWKFTTNHATDVL